MRAPLTRRPGFGIYLILLPVCAQTAVTIVLLVPLIPCP
jgi:hypothetical protein